jgi:hypothetical protein
MVLMRRRLKSYMVFLARTFTGKKYLPKSLPKQSDGNEVAIGFKKSLYRA